MHKKTLWISTALTVVLGGVPANVAAQEGDSDTIVVTAQRREQNIQDVPLSVLALSGEDLVNRQIDAFDQLQFVAPGIVFRAGINARQSSTSIRGIGTGLFNTGIEGSVAVVVDGVVMGAKAPASSI